MDVEAWWLYEPWIHIHDVDCPANSERAILSDIEPGGGSGDEPYALPADVEFVLILAGQLRIGVAGEDIVLDEGDAYTFPGSTEHTFAVAAGAGPARVLWVFSPALPDTARAGAASAPRDHC